MTLTWSRPCVETIAHLRDNGRFVTLYDAGFDELLELFDYDAPASAETA